MPLRTDRKQLHALLKRFDVAHFAYNAVLQELLQRLDAMRADLRFEAVRKMPKGRSGDEATQEQKDRYAARRTAFATLRKEFGFSEYAAHEVVGKHVRASHYLEDLIDSHTAQTLASRAFDACQKFASGVRGRPRFKRKGEIASIEGKGPSSPLNWKDDHVVWGGKRRDRRLVLRPIFDAKDKQGVEVHALSGKVKYVRVIRRKIRGESQFFVQLVCEGNPKQRFEPRDQVAAIDLGPSIAAIVSPDRAALVSFLPTIDEDLAAKRILQRAMDRSRRATNSHCFNPDGTWKHGKRQTVFSKGYCELRSQLAEQERVMAERRDRAQGQLSNIVIRDFGKVVNTERLSKKAWQKLWGRRMKATAPGMFMNKVDRKAGNAGGSLNEFNAGRYKLSQYDHTRGDFVKKPLSLRIHELRDGSGQVAQRDLYSAWLALFVQTDGLDASRAKSAWAGAYPHLVHAASHPVKASTWTPKASARFFENVRVACMQNQSECTVRSSVRAKSCAPRCENHRTSVR